MRRRDLRPTDIAQAMGLQECEVWYASRHTERLYRSTRHERTTKGKIRAIDEPLPEWKKRFKRLHNFIQKELRPPAYVHGGVKRRSCFTSARSHKRRRYVLTRDIKDCFPSISTDALANQLVKVGFRRQVANLLSRLLTVRGYVPQGCPTSGDAQNFIFATVDRQINSACVRNGAGYGRMCDDIIVSCDSLRAAKVMGSSIQHRSAEIGLRVNDEKLVDHGIQTDGQPQFVHNLIVNHPRGIAINDVQRRKAIAEAESLVRGARSVAPESLVAIARKRQRVVGMRCHCQQADHGPAKHLRRLVRQADRNIVRALRSARIVAFRNKWWTNSEVSRLSETWRRRLREENGGSLAPAEHLGVDPGV